MEITDGCFNWVSLGLTFKHLKVLERLAGTIPPRVLLNYDRKKIYDIELRNKACALGPML